MKITILPRRSAPGGLEKLLGCLLLSFALCLLTTFPATAQAESLTPFSADLDGYANLDFYVPSDVAVEPESLEEANYTDGREVKAALLLNGSRLSLHLLYPCQAPGTQMDANALKSAIDAYNPALMQAIYNPTPLNISGQSALWGQVGSQLFVAYQPSIQTVALVLIDESLDENTLEYLLGSLQVTVNQGSSPLWPGYCPDTSGSEAVPAEPAKPVNENIAADNSNQLESTMAEVKAKPTMPEPEPSKNQNAAGINAAQKMLDALKK